MKRFKNDILEATALQLSLDYSCSPEDFLKTENTIVNSKILRGRRNLRMEKDFFRLGSMGNGVVASISPEIFTFTKALLEQFSNPIEVFDAKGIYFINRELEKYGKVIGAFNQYYIPETPFNFTPDEGYRIKVFEGNEIKALYEHGKFPNAFLYNTTELRRDVLAVALFNGITLAAVAGASNDSERFWQIGIDVLPEYREQGIASLLVSSITQEILMRGAIPYYGTWWSNIASRKVAAKCGYYPAWVEISAVDINLSQK